MKKLFSGWDELNCLICWVFYPRYLDDRYYPNIPKNVGELYDSKFWVEL